MIYKTSKEDDNLNNGNSKEDLLTWQVIQLFILNILKIEIFIKSFIFRTTDNKHKATNTRTRILPAENWN